MKQPRTLILIASSILMLLAGSILAPTSASDGSAGYPVVATLGVGDATFWSQAVGPYASADGANQLRGSLAVCDMDVNCFDFGLEVAPDAARLRVALDTALDFGNETDLAIYSPSGEEHMAARQLNGAAIPFSYEVFVDSPEEGLWRVRAIVYHSHESVGADLRLRAKLEAAADPPEPPVALPPNMKPLPPYRLSFSGCRPDEVMLLQPTRCLRFGFGWQNVGDGPMDLRYETNGETANVTQRVHWSNGTWEERPAGVARWHAVHGHYHYEDFVNVTLHKVLHSKSGKVSLPITQSQKLGVCGHDWKMSEWERFFQAPVTSDDSGVECLDGALGAPLVRQGLSAGWLDYYGPGAYGNFIEFGLNEDGLYLLRMKLDADDQMLEGAEDDNFGYAYVEVTGDEVTLLERGYGTSPWDKDAVPLPASP